MSSFIAKVAFYPTVLYTRFMTAVSRRRWYNRIDETVILGALPLRGMTQQLLSENVRAIISVTEKFEGKTLVNSPEDWHRHGVSHLNLSAVDYVGTPSQDQITEGVQFIMEHRKRHVSVYVHCKAGRTRSTTLVVCYLIQANKWNPEEALDFVKTKRSHVWIRERQWNSIETFYNELRSNNDT